MKRDLSTLTAFFLIGCFAVSRAFPAQPAGTVVAWGNFDFGQYGIYSGFQTNGLITISNHVITNATAISAGGMVSLAILENSNVVRWGQYFPGERDNPPRREVVDTNRPVIGTNGPIIFNGLPLPAITAVAAGNTHVLLLRKDGTVLALGGGRDVKGNLGPEVLKLNELGNIRAIAAGDHRSLALKEDGTVEVWGRGNPAPQGLTNVIAIAAGVGTFGAEDVALKKDGAVVTWNVRGVPGQQARQPEGMSNIVAIASGTAHILALQDNGIVWGWGFNPHGEATGEPTELNRSAARILSSGDKVLDSKTAMAANENQFDAGIVRINGKVLDNVSAIAAGDGCSLALKKDGTLVFWGDDHRGELRPPADLNGVIAIALSQSHGLAITTNRALLSR